MGEFSSCLMQCFPWSQLFPGSPSNSSILTAASSSSTSGHNEGDTYEIFISFRGDDVRRGFLSHLRKALKDKHIKIFIDDELERGKDITEDLIRIIEQSYLSIVIFSQDYPNSEYCLKELEKIRESMKQRGQTVIPVFYLVDPSHVQKLEGNYAIRSQSIWRDALVEISNLSGFDSGKFEDDVKLIEDIVGTVSEKLREICPTISHDDHLIGIDSSLNDVLHLLRLDSTNDVRMVGIWGMGGIGKTTLARMVFDNIMKKFHGHHHFFEHVSDKLRMDDGNLRNKVIQGLLRDTNINISSSSSVDDSIRRRLKQTKILLVLDDVQTCMELNFVLKKSGLYTPNSFCPGSRIIVTSRDLQVLNDVRFESYIYEVKKLKEDQALEMLSQHAFGQNKLQQGYENISEEVLRYTDGVPLALEVLGSYLKNREISYWEATMTKFYNIGPPQITQILRVSYDGLDREEKDIFLDFACFFIESDRESFEEHVINSFGDHARIGIDRLIDKCLLTERNGIIDMHDLLRQMGREIVCGEKESKGQSRLWEFEDVKDALTNNRGTENVEAIKLYPRVYYYFSKGTENVEAIKLYPRGKGKIDVNPEAFKSMRKLRYLNLSNGDISCTKGLDFLPDSIRQLKWLHYPLNSLPSNYDPEKLVELDLSYSNLTEINWSKPLMNLKRIMLSSCPNLIRISDLAMAPNLETLYATSLSDEMSSSIIEQYFWDVDCQPTKVHQLYVNGSQVPDWMTHHNECGSSVSLDPGTLCHSVIFCVVFSSKWPPNRPTMKAVIRTSETEYCEDIFGYTAYEQDTSVDFLLEKPDIDLDSEEEKSYVVLWNRNHDCEFVTDVSFQLTFANSENAKIIKCGVCPIKNHRKQKV